MFVGEADTLAVFLASMLNRGRHFNCHQLITMPINNGTTQNLLTHYGQVSLDNRREHAVTYMNTPTSDAQDNDMFYYLVVLLTNECHTTVLLYADVYTITNIPAALSLLKQIIILTRVDNPQQCTSERCASSPRGSCCSYRATSLNIISGFNRILSKVQKSFWSCTHLNSCQKYICYI